MCAYIIFKTAIIDIGKEAFIDKIIEKYWIFNGFLSSRLAAQKMMINVRVVNLSFEQLNLKVWDAFSSLIG